MGIMRQYACLVVNPIRVYNYGFLFDCTTVAKALGSLRALTISFNRLVWCLISFRFSLAVTFDASEALFLCFIIVY